MVNKANSKKRFKIRPISTYLFSLSIMTFLLLSLPSAWVYYLLKGTDDVFTFCSIMAVIMLVYLINCIIHSFWYLGLYRLKDRGISFYAPLRKSIHVPYDSIRYIGIDFGIVSGSRQFWIYFSTEPIPAKYVHKIHGMPVNRKCMRVQYSDKRYQELLNVLPDKQKKELIKAATILRVYSDHDE